MIVLVLAGAVVPAWAIDGIPEPDLVIYGKAFSKSDNSPVTITSATMTVSDGLGNMVAMSAASTPPIEIVQDNGAIYYLARVHFDTRTVGGMTFNAPANSLPLFAASPTYHLSVSINGQPGTFATPAQATFTYAVADLGRIDRVDFFINTTGLPDDGYLDWARGFFGNASFPQAARSANPTGDGLSNFLKFAFGLDPTVASNGAITVAGGLITHRGGPTTLLQPIQNGVDFRALYGRRKGYLAAGLTYAVQFSPDLVIWQTSPATPTVVADDGEIEAVTVPYPLFIDNRKVRFFRVQITGP